MVSQYLRICVETKFAYDAIAAAAMADGWKEVDFKTAPLKIKDTDHSAVKMTAWKTDETSNSFIVYAIKTANPAGRSSCGIAGFDIEKKKVVDLLIADGRFKDTSPFPSSITLMHFEGGGSILLNQGPPGPEDKTAGHTSETLIQTL